MTTVNDNIQPFETIEERDLHAYVDGLLDDQRARKVEDYLKRHPEKAAEIRDYVEYNQLLCKIYERETDEAVPQRLLSVLNRPVRNIWPAVAKVAAVFMLCLLSAGGGWMSAYNNAGSVAPVTEEDGMVRNFLHQVAMNTEAPFEAAPIQKLDINTGTQTDPLNWLTQKVALEMQAPNLTQAGYTLDSRRLVTRGTQEFVELKYINSSKDAIKLYMKTRWEKDAPTIEFAQNDGQAIAYWQEGPLVYALSGALDQSRAAQIAQLIRSAMTDVPDSAPQAQDVQIMTPQLVSPVPPVQQPQVNYDGIVQPSQLAPQEMQTSGQY
jgi:anti-sigma factor RsiW